VASKAAPATPEVHVAATVASAAAVALLAQPVVGAIIGIKVMGDPLTLSFIIGGVLILGALIVTSIPERAPSEVAMLDRKADEL
jgi:drug/metabolite transporter (DMT)-like permease